jgi:hypothetical protein
MARQQLSIGGTEGCVATGLGVNVISGVGATRTLTQAESGSLCMFDAAAGVVYTLPSTPIAGSYFDFAVSVSITSNSAKVITGVATNFIGGGINISSSTAGANDFFVATAASTVFIAADSSTKGGLIGGFFRLTAISTTVWQCQGVLVGSGTLADPFG